jgi:type III restriction enzyme
MYRGRDDLIEKVSVMGTAPFMDFVESIEREGVELERRAMGKDTEAVAPVVIEVDKNDPKKDSEKLDIEIPKMSRRFGRNYKRLESLDIANLGNVKVPYRTYTEEQLREIVFKEITTAEISHTTQLPTSGDIDASQAVGWFAMKIQNDLRLVGGYDVIYGLLKDFIRDHLFDRSVVLEDRMTMRNLSEGDATMQTLESFKRGINALTIEDSGSATVVDSIKLRDTRSFPVNDQEYYVPKKSMFNRIVGDSHLELRFAAYLDDCKDVVSFAKLYQRINFKLDYVDAEGRIRDYYPDFIVKLADDTTFVVETKGLEDVDVPLKMARLKAWCEDINQQQERRFDFVYVTQTEFESLLDSYTNGHRTNADKTFKVLVDSMTEYK